MNELISPTFNLVVLIAVLAYYTRKPIRDFVTNRHHTVRDELEKVSQLLRYAHAQNEEFTAKLRAVDAELAALRDQVNQDAQAAKQRIAADAQRLSATIVSDARSASEALFSDLKSELFAELGSHIIDKSERILKDRLTGDDRARIRQEFSSQVETVR